MAFVSIFYALGMVVTVVGILLFAVGHFLGRLSYMETGADCMIVGGALVFLLGLFRRKESVQASPPR